MLGIDEYVSLICDDVTAIPSLKRPTNETLGDVLANDLYARYPVPPFDNSAMDGFALRSSDTNTDTDTVELPVVRDIAAGPTSNEPVTPGCAVRIMTGAAVPPGVDTVVPVEDTDSSPGVIQCPESVRVPSGLQAGRHIRHRGEDVAQGQLVANKGVTITPALISAALSVGHGQLEVRRRVKVAIISTGDELRGPEEELVFGTIPDSNSALLAALVSEAGAQVQVVGRCHDDPAAVADFLTQAAGADLLLSSGGVSAGAFDVMKSFGREHGLSFHKVAMQPGKPQGFGSLCAGENQMKVLMLPGNPVSVFVSFHLLVKPVLDILAGRAKQWTPLSERLIPAHAGMQWKAAGKRTQIMPAKVELRADGLYVYPVHPLGSGSHLVASLHHAQALAVVPAGVEMVAEGDAISVLKDH